MENRRKAMERWNKLSNEDKKNFYNVYKSKNFTPAQKESQLTSREIELIYSHGKQ